MRAAGGPPEASSLAIGTIALKLKTADFRLRTRSRRLTDPTQLAETLFRTASTLLASEADGVTRFRLIGVGDYELFEGQAADPPTLFDRELDPAAVARTRDGSNSRQARRELGTNGPRHADRRQYVVPYDIPAQGRVVTDEQLLSAVRFS